MDPLLGNTRCILLLVAGILATLTIPAPAQTIPSKPNIIFILVDDFSAMDLDDNLPSSPGAAFMPNLKQYIRGPGLTFTRHYVTESLCCPSRATILRGQYPHNTGITTNTYEAGGGFSKFYELGGENSTIATWLQAGGYQTMLAGKYLNQYPQPPPGVTLSNAYVPPGWTEWYGWIELSGYRFFNYDMIENGRRVHYGSAEQDYMTDVLSRKTIDFLDRTDGPFFIYLAPAAPHGPATPAPRHRTLFSNISALRGPSFNEADMSDKPWPYRDTPLRTPDQINQIDEYHRNQLRSMMAVDDMIKAIVDKLQQKGQLANTYIFFTSDNGFHMGEHRFEPGKNTAYEEDIRVPLIVVGPGVRAGQQDQITLNNDFAPTFADLAGVNIPSNYVVDGRSIRPLLSATTPVQPWRTNFMTETSFNYFLGALRTISSTANTLYVEYTLRGQPASSFNREFYDLTVDPNQLQNGYEAASRPLINYLAARLASFRSCAGASCRAAEDAAIGPPQISPNAIVNAASYKPSIAPGSLISIFGSDLARNIGTPSNVPLPATLAGTSVTLGGRPTPLLYVSPTQINAQVPYEVTPGTVPVVVRTGGLETASVNATISPAAPGIFMFGENRAVVQNQDGSLNTSENPAHAGSIIVAYLTGLGNVDHPVPTGAAAPLSPLSSSLFPVNVTVAGMTADVQFAGLTPGFVGLMQLNVRVPQVPAGTHPIEISINGSASNPAIISVR
jgi:uncharacterized protein (TIGR03437 family)